MNSVGETVENYLETILILTKDKDSVRAVEIANEMGYSKPTLSVMLKQLKESGFVDLDEGGGVFLTPQGRSIAERTYERHNTLAQMLMDLGVTRETAFEDACKIEHFLSKESFDALKNHYLHYREDNERK